MASQLSAYGRVKLDWFCFWDYFVLFFFQDLKWYSFFVSISRARICRIFGHVSPIKVRFRSLETCMQKAVCSFLKKETHILLKGNQFVLGRPKVFVSVRKRWCFRVLESGCSQVCSRAKNCSCDSDNRIGPERSPFTILAVQTICELKENKTTKHRYIFFSWKIVL